MGSYFSKNSKTEEKMIEEYLLKAREMAFTFISLVRNQL